MINAKPTDIDAQSDEESTDLSASDESDQYSSAPIGIFTKYPDDPNDDYDAPVTYKLSYDNDEKLRTRRRVNNTIASASEMVNPIENQTTEEPNKVPVKSLITAVETDLITTALQATTQLRKRSTNSDVNQSKENQTSAEEPFDVNQNFFEELFNYTRPERETEEKDVKIPLNDLVGAVESTLVHSAQNLRDTKPSNESGESNDQMNSLHRIYRDDHIEVKKMDPTKPLVNLGLLSPITFKPVTAEQDDEAPISTTELPKIKKTNITVIQASNAVSLVPGPDHKLAHVQHQAISQTVFHSNLAFFPTITPKMSTTEMATDTTIKPQNEPDPKHEQSPEIEADPVIFTTF